MYIGLHVQCPLYMCSADCTCAVPTVHVQCPLYMCSAHCTCAVPTVHVRSPLYMCSPHCTCAVPTVHVRCPLYMCGAHCTCAVPTVHVRCPLYMYSAHPFFLSGFNETLISRQIFEKYSNIKFHGNPSSGAELFHADRQTDVTKLTVAFRNFANTPNNMLMHTQTVNMCGSNCRL